MIEFTDYRVAYNYYRKNNMKRFFDRSINENVECALKYMNTYIAPDKQTDPVVRDPGDELSQSILESLINHLEVNVNGSFCGDVPNDELWNLAKEQIPMYSGDAMVRAKQCIAGFMALGLPKIAACAMVGVYLVENKCNPGSWCDFEKEEKNENKSTKGGGYGAGIGSWTGPEHKRNVLKLIGREDVYPDIWKLTFEEQIIMAYKELMQSKWGVENIVNAPSIEHACVAATYYVLGRNRASLKNYGFTYQAITEEQQIHTLDLIHTTHRSTPSTYHKTGLMVKTLLGQTLYNSL